MKVLATVLVGSRPREAAFTPDGKRAYVTGEIGGTVSVIDVPAHEVVATITLEDGETKPKGVAVTPDGKRALVANGAAHHVAVIDTQTNEVSATVSVGRRPWGIALTPDGKKAYVANGVSNDVSVIDVETRKVVAHVPAGKMPWGVATGRQQRQQSRPGDKDRGGLMWLSIPVAAPRPRRQAVHRVQGDTD
jgi:YVTN family beta-propeller protein